MVLFAFAKTFVSRSKITFSALIFLLIGNFSVAEKLAAQNSVQAKPLFITAAFEVNVREAPSAGAKEIAEVPVGTIVRSLERSTERQAIGGKTDYWHRIETVSANKKSGWIFGGFLRQFDGTKRENIYSEIAAERLKAAGESFSDNVELFDFLTGVLPAIKTPAILAELSFARLVALKNALSAIPIDKQSGEPYKTLVSKQKANIVYSDPSAQWYVRSDLFWNLARKYRNMPIAEKIAWAAANNPLPGECEGYLNCYLYLLKETQGGYLEQFPRGAHAAESLKTIRESLEPIVDDAAKKEIYTRPTEVSEKAEFYQALANLRRQVSKTRLVEKDHVLRQLDKIAEGYK